MKRLTTAVLALALLGTAPAMAADYNSDRDQHHSDYRDNNRDLHRSDYRDNNRHRDNFQQNRWHRGERLGRAWWLYEPVNWRYHHFRRPAYGYHWIYADGFYLLVNRNGVVIDVSA